MFNFLCYYVAEAKAFSNPSSRNIAHYERKSGRFTDARGFESYKSYVSSIALDVKLYSTRP